MPIREPDVRHVDFVVGVAVVAVVVVDIDVVVDVVVGTLKELLGFDEAETETSRKIKILLNNISRKVFHGFVAHGSRQQQTWFEVWPRLTLSL